VNIKAISGISQYLTYSSNNLKERRLIPMHMQCTLMYVPLHKLTC